MISRFIQRLFSILRGQGKCERCCYYDDVLNECDGRGYQTPYGNGEEKLGDPEDNINNDCLNWDK